MTKPDICPVCGLWLIYDGHYECCPAGHVHYFRP